MTRYEVYYNQVEVTTGSLLPSMSSEAVERYVYMSELARGTSPIDCAKCKKFDTYEEALAFFNEIKEDLYSRYKGKYALHIYSFGYVEIEELVFSFDMDGEELEEVNTLDTYSPEYERR